MTFGLVLTLGCTKDTEQKSKSDDVTAAGASRAVAVKTATSAEPKESSKGDSECTGSPETGCCGGWDQAATEEPKIAANAEWTTIKVSGMTCGGCAKRIQATLAGVEGILGVKADHQSGEVKIAAAPGTEDVRGKVTPRITALGYKVVDI